MAKVTFKKGLLANLASTAQVEGQLLITTDERAIYFDTGTDRIRLGDFIEVATIAKLPEQGANESALYYVKEANVLAKWDPKGGSGNGGWIHINEDTGATNIEVTGEGQATSGISASYDENGRKIIITIGKSLIDTEALSEKIGEINQDTVKGYVDAEVGKVNTAESGLAGRVGTLESQVTTIQGSGEGSITKAVKDAKSELLGTAEDTSSENTIYGAKKGVEEAKEAVETAKSALIGQDNDEPSANTIKGAKKYTNQQIKAQLGATYKAKGSKATLEEVPEPSEEELGNVYNVEAEFTTTEKFLEGTSHKYPAGTNVVIVAGDSEDYKYDVLSGIVDLSSYATTTSVESAIAQAKIDLQGTSTKDVTTTSIGAAADDVLTKAEAAATKALNTALTWGEFTVG